MNHPTASRTRLVTLACRALAVCLLGVSSACSSGGGGGGGSPAAQDDIATPDLSSLEGPPFLFFTEEENTEVSRFIDAADGGTIMTVGSAGLELDIPPGALPDDTLVTMTVFSDPDLGPFTVGANLEPDGLVLDEPATLTITFSEPLPKGASVRIIEGPSNPAEVFDTGLVAEISADRRQAFITIENFSQHACNLNCHGHTLRRIVQGLLKGGFESGEIVSRVCSRMADELGENDDVCRVGDEDNEGEFRKQVRETFEGLASFDCEFVQHAQLQAYLREFYRLEPLFLDSQGSGDSLVVDAVDDDCLGNLDELAHTSDLPPVLNFGSGFRIGGRPDREVVSGNDTPFFDGVPHSAAIVVDRNGNVVFENGVVVGDAIADAWEDAFQNKSMNSTRILRVAPADLDQLNEFRGLTSGQAANRELIDLGLNDDLLIGGRPEGGRSIPWPSVRIWVPANVGTSGPCGKPIADDDDPTEPLPDAEIVAEFQIGSLRGSFELRAIAGIGTVQGEDGPVITSLVADPSDFLLGDFFQFGMSRSLSAPGTFRFTEFSEEDPDTGDVEITEREGILFLRLEEIRNEDDGTPVTFSSNGGTFTLESFGTNAGDRLKGTFSTPIFGNQAILVGEDEVEFVRLTGELTGSFDNTLVGSGSP